MVQQSFMSEAEKQAFEAAAPDLAAEMKKRAENRHKHNFSLNNENPDALGYFLLHLNHDRLTEIELHVNHFTDAVLPILAEICRRSARIEKLDCTYSALTAEGLGRFYEDFGHCASVRELDFTRNRLKGGGEMLAKWIAACPRLESLNLQECQLTDNDLLALAPALRRHPALREVFIGKNGGLEGNKAMADALFSRPDLCIVGLVHSSDRVNRQTDALLCAHHPVNLYKCDVQISDTAKRIIGTNNHVQDDILENGQDAALSVAWSKNKAGMRRDAGELFMIETRYPAFAFELSREKDSFEYKDNSAYDLLCQSLPQLPPKAGDGRQDVDRLFASQPYPYGLSPLDNPRLFGSAEEARAFLGSLPWSPELLSRRTEQGSGVLDAALLRLPLKEVVREVNLKGLSIDRAALQERDGQPSQLFRLVETTHQGMALFSQANLAGQATGDVMWMRGKLPDYQRPGFVARHMAGTDRDTGMARGR